MLSRRRGLLLLRHYAWDTIIERLGSCSVYGDAVPEQLFCQGKDDSVSAQETETT